MAKLSGSGCRGVTSCALMGLRKPRRLSRTDLSAPASSSSSRSRGSTEIAPPLSRCASPDRSSPSVRHTTSGRSRSSEAPSRTSAGSGSTEVAATTITSHVSVSGLARSLRSEGAGVRSTSSDAMSLAMRSLTLELCPAITTRKIMSGFRVPIRRSFGPRARGRGWTGKILPGDPGREKAEPASSSRPGGSGRDRPVDSATRRARPLRGSTAELPREVGAASPPQRVEDLRVRRQLELTGLAAVHPQEVGENRCVFPAREASRAVLGHGRADVLEQMSDRLGHPREGEDRTAELAPSMAGRAHRREQSLAPLGLLGGVEGARGRPAARLRRSRRRVAETRPAGYRRGARGHHRRHDDGGGGLRVPPARADPPGHRRPAADPVDQNLDAEMMMSARAHTRSKSALARSASAVLP